jgi:hypothetical protein
MIQFLNVPCRGVILKTIDATGVPLRVQLWSVNQRATEAKIRYQETSSEDTAEE